MKFTTDRKSLEVVGNIMRKQDLCVTLQVPFIQISPKYKHIQL